MTTSPFVEVAVERPAVERSAADARDDEAAVDAPGEEIRALTPDAMASWPLPLDPDGDKRDRGTVLVIGGSPGTVGAAVLAGLAALRIGAGRLQLAIAEPSAAALTVAVPEALVVGLPVRPDGTLRPKRALAVIERLVACADAVLIGPGLVSNESTARLLRRVAELVHDRSVLVVDAAALTQLDDPVALLASAGGRLAVVANRVELARLAERTHVGATSATAVDDGSAATVRAVAGRLRASVTSFGVVGAASGSLWRATSASPGLGTSGSGDVLSGLVAGAAARGASDAQAACWGTFVHTEAGERLSRRGSTLGYLAREIVAEVPAVIRDIERRAAAL